MIEDIIKKIDKTPYENMSDSEKIISDSVDSIAKKLADDIDNDILKNILDN